MSRKRSHRKPIQPLPPRGLRQKLSPQQVRDLGLAHVTNLDALSRGEADETILWQWVGGTLTWSKVAERLNAGVPEMADQLALVASVIQRYGRTGRIIFTGPEYQCAKDGCAAMDQLAEMVDLPTANEAADWAEARVNQMAAEAKLPTRIIEEWTAV